MKIHTKLNGLNVITIFNEKNEFKNLPGLFDIGELKDLYKDWKIVSYQEFITPLEQHGDFKPHTHSISAIIAERIK